MQAFTAGTSSISSVLLFSEVFPPTLALQLVTVRRISDASRSSPLKPCHLFAGIILYRFIPQTLPLCVFVLFQSPGAGLCRRLCSTPRHHYQRHVDHDHDPAHALHHNHIINRTILPLPRHAVLFEGLQAGWCRKEQEPGRKHSCCSCEAQMGGIMVAQGDCGRRGSGIDTRLFAGIEVERYEVAKAHVLEYSH